jgi:tRNA pseudouridine38-40 synthase
MNDYLIHIQYLGFRFHGWQRQPGVKTVESMLIKTLETVLGTDRFKILGASRTDAMVSARHSAFSLSVAEKIPPQALLEGLNRNLPPDIRALAAERPPAGFNIINSPRTKTYHYYFSCGEKPHPFCAPFLASFPEALDIGRMERGAARFEGEHDFRAYCTRPGEQTRTRRRIEVSRIDRAAGKGIFPEQTWVYKVRSRGFMRNQVRLMMGQLLCLGRGETDLAGLEESLAGKPLPPLKTIAPASGLVLHRIDFDHLEADPAAEGGGGDIP